MASLCLAAGTLVVALTTPTFLLSWEHSIEHTEWQELWRVGEIGGEGDDKTALIPLESRIVGHGVGMEPNGPILRYDGKFIVYRPQMPPQKHLTLPDSDFTEPMQLCLENAACKPLRAYFPVPPARDQSIVLSVGKDGVCSAIP